MKFGIGAAFAAALIATFAPPAARAEAPPQVYDFETHQTDALSAGEYDGRLRMRVSAGGIVSGSFTNTDGIFSSVSGGVDGTKIWIDIGNASPTGVHLFTGTFRGGKLTASAARGLHVWTLEGSPRTDH
jgi:hypothetical protein